MDTLNEKIKKHPFSDNSRNENEKKVAEVIARVSGEFPDTCFCSVCLDNIFCIALNSLPPKYENAVIHNLLKVNSCSNTEVESAVRNAIKTVAGHPKAGGDHYPKN